MRNITMSLLFALAACSAGDLTTEPPHPPIRHPSVNPTIWSGERACAVGLVRVDLQLFDRRLDQSELVPTGAVLRVTVDGAPHIESAAPRLRVDGADLGSGSTPDGDALDVFVGLGARCEWITVLRIG
jgi:hypothetical protein